MASGQSILDILPFDIVELVIQESTNYNREDLCGLRLVCKALNKLVEPRVFSIVTIQFKRDDLEKWRSIPEFLSSLASGTSPYVRWAKQLRLNTLVPIQFTTDDPWARDEKWEGEEREAMLACQKEWLTPAIEVLDRVEHVHYAATSRGPYREVLCSLAKLPQLRDLSMDLLDPFHLKEVSLAGFSNLNSIRFSCVRMTQQILDDMKGLLARSRSITQFALRPFAPSFLNFSSLFEDAMKPNFSPTLKQLTIGIDIKLSPSVAPFFRYLTSLETDVTSIQLLRIFQGSGIRLQELVAPLQQEVINYLLSYSGLRSFAGDPKLLPRTTEGKMIISQFFHAVLPKHQESIQSITFKQTGPLPGLLSITQPYLDQGVYLCKNLECLTLIYYFPSVREEHISDVLPLANLFSDISNNLPHLHTLRLELTRSYWEVFASFHNQYVEDVFREFSAHIVSSRSIFEAKRQPQFFLDAAGTRFTPFPSSSGSEPDLRGERGQHYRFDSPTSSSHE